MAYTADYEICNLALIKLGQKSITAAQLTTPGSSQPALACSVLFEPVRDAFMRSFDWRFATRRLYFDIDNFTDTITATTAASPVVVTGTDISDANILDYHGVYIWDTGIDDLDHETFCVRNLNDTNQTCELYYPDAVTPYDGTSIGTASTGYLRAIPLSQYDYMFKLPSDCLRVLYTSEGESYTIDKNYLLTDNDEEYVEYISLITNVSDYHSTFIMCLATKLASELAIALSAKDELKESILKEHEYYMKQAEKLELIQVNPKRRKRTDLSSWQKAGR